MSTEQDITHNIQAINPNLEKLKQAFPHCFDKNGDFDFTKFKAELDSSDINIAKEGYSLDWLGKSYARILASDAATTLLKEDEVHNAKPENANSQNLLIKGDNLEVLKHLSNAYYEKVKMIYIDPPYNTGSDGFVYNDDRKFTAKQLQDLAGVSEDEAKHILEFTQSNSNSHSAWLTFMYPRLYIAKQLLKDDGVIFVSIDDNEVAQLRLLMDEVFGEENFVADLIWKNKKGGGNDSKYIAVENEHIIFYSNSKNHLDNLFQSYDEEYLKRYKEEDEKGLFYWDTFKRKSGKQYYSIVCPDGSVLEDDENGNPISWLRSEKTFKKDLQSGDIRIIKISDKWSVQFKQRIPEGKKPRSILDSYGTTSTGSEECLNYFKKAVFDNPKPSSLIKHLLNIITYNDDFILDFFGGSGTTADAVMQLNEDGGNRKFILVQLPEQIDAKKSKVAYDFVKDELGVNPPTIFEITKERIVRAAKQIGDTSGFKIFETTPIWEDYDFKADKLANAGKLFDDDKLTETDVKALFTTWKTYDGSPLTELVQEIDLAGYKAYYTKQKLYLMHKGFSTATLKALLEQIDTDANFNPTAIIAFGYYFESKALREIAENIKTYNNKKNIDIDFITRY